VLQLDHPAAKALATFLNPEETEREDAKANALIRYAVDIKDWPLLDYAVRHKIEQQRGFVDWWGITVTPRRTRKSVNAPPGEQSGMSVAEATVLTGITQQTVSRWKTRLKDPQGYRRYICAAARRAAFGTNAPARLSSESFEWYTEPVYVEPIHAVLGGVDLDPSSSEAANKIIQARSYYSIEDDGLTKPWPGTVYHNPPYCGQTGKWVAKLLEEYWSGRCTEAILLVNNLATSTIWFQPLWNHTLCFVFKKIKFIPGAGNPATDRPTCGNIFAYLGPNADLFEDVFENYGQVVRSLFDPRVPR